MAVSSFLRFEKSTSLHLVLGRMMYWYLYH